MAGANGGASGGIKCHRRSAQQPETHPDFYVGDVFFGFGFNFDFVVGKIVRDVDPDAHLSAVSSRETDLVCLGEYNFLDVNVVDHIAWQIRREEDLCWVLAVRYLLEGVGQS